MTKVINCTPHDINLDLNGEIRTYEKSGIIPRMSVSETEAESIGDVPCKKSIKGAVENLPEREDGVFLIVSGMIFDALSERDDLIAPNTGPSAIRNEKGHIVAVRNFLRR